MKARAFWIALTTLSLVLCGWMFFRSSESGRAGLERGSEQEARQHSHSAAPDPQSTKSAERPLELARSSERSFEQAHSTERPTEHGPEYPSNASPETPTPGVSPLVTSIREAMRGAIPRIRNCYDDALHENGALEGRLDLELELREDGTVLLGRVLEDSLEGLGNEVRPSTRRSMHGCIEQALGDVEVALPRGTRGITRVTYPVWFNLDQEGI